MSKPTVESEGEIDGDAPFTAPCGCHLPRNGVAILCDEHEAEINDDWEDEDDDL